MERAQAVAFVRSPRSLKTQMAEVGAAVVALRLESLTMAPLQVRTGEAHTALIADCRLMVTSLQALSNSRARGAARGAI